MVVARMSLDDMCVWPGQASFSLPFKSINKQCLLSLRITDSVKTAKKLS